LAEPVIAELERILIEKLHFEPERWRQVEALLVELAVEMAPPLRETPPEPVTGDPNDDLILACAVEAGVDALISGDRRHLLPIGRYRGIRVITPQALLAELRSG
jgi:uncharacterized protein